MHAAGTRIDHARQLVRVSGLQLRDAAVFEQQLGQRMVERHLLERVFVGRRRAGRRFLDRLDAELAE